MGDLEGDFKVDLKGVLKGDLDRELFNSLELDTEIEELIITWLVELDQSEVSIEVTWSVVTNQRLVLLLSLTWLELDTLWGAAEGSQGPALPRPVHLALGGRKTAVSEVWNVVPC